MGFLNFGLFSCQFFLDFPTFVLIKRGAIGKLMRHFYKFFLLCPTFKLSKLDALEKGLKNKVL